MIEPPKGREWIQEKTLGGEAGDENYEKSVEKTFPFWHKPGSIAGVDESTEHDSNISIDEKLLAAEPGQNVKPAKGMQFCGWFRWRLYFSR